MESRSADRGAQTASRALISDVDEQNKAVITPGTGGVLLLLQCCASSSGQLQGKLSSGTGLCLLRV